MITLNERNFLFTFFLSLLSSIFFKSFLVLLVAGLTIIVGGLFVLNDRRLSKGLPLNSRYNSHINSLEFHIDRTNNRNVVFKNLLDLVAVGKEKNHKIIFLTWHIKEDNLKRIFRHSVTIKKPHWFTYYTNLISAVFYSDVPGWLLLPKIFRKKYKNHKYILVEIDPNKVVLSECNHIEQIRHVIS